MTRITRRQALAFAASIPAASIPLIPGLLVEPARAAGLSAERYEGRVVVVLRMKGGNDGFNTVVPVNDDRYYRARPNIALAKRETLSVSGHEAGLHPALADFMRLMDDGHAGILQSVGYPQPSRSHLRSTEIWQAGSLAADAPAAGWLGRYLDSGCGCDVDVAGVQLGGEPALTLASATRRSRTISHPQLLLRMNPEHAQRVLQRGPVNEPFSHLAVSQSALAGAAALVQHAAGGSGARYGYPDTSFGRGLRWTADMIETETPVRAYHVELGSFETGAASFDTHVDQLAQHEQLYAELGRGVRAFVEQLRATHDLDRVLLVTYSDFGRQLGENTTRGTEHGDASVLLYAGGAVRPGLQGPAADLGQVTNGGLNHQVDFRAVYADILENWFDVPADVVLDERVEPFPLVRRI